MQRTALTSEDIGAHTDKHLEVFVVREGIHTDKSVIQVSATS